MKPPRKQDNGATRAERIAVWACYALAAGLFILGQSRLLKGDLALGGALAVVAVLAAALAYLLPVLDWAASVAWLKGSLEALKRRPPRPPSARALKAGRADKPAGLPLPGFFARLRGAVARVLGGFFDRYFPDDRIILSRAWLFLPAVASLLLSQLALGQGGTVKAVVYFAGAGLLAAIYLQGPDRPLQLGQLRQNLVALGWFSLSLPFQALGAWLLHARFQRPGMVWLGAGLCALASAGAIWALRRRPFNFELPEDRGPAPAEAPAEAEAQPVREPFFTPERWSLLSALLAGAALTGYAAIYIFRGERPGWSVAMGFSSIVLLIASFPWLPHGLAWTQRLAPSLRAVGALLTALAAFYLGSKGQRLIETNQLNAGLLWFLAGGIVLVLGLSRFEGRGGPAPAPQPSPAWPRLEVALVLALAAASFGFRIWNVGNFPYGAEGDEAGGGMWAMDALRGTVEHPLIHQNYPLAFFSVTAVFFKWMGVGLETLRLHSVIFGTLSIISTYLFMRLLFGRWSAALATLLMSFSYWHLHYSRFGHYNIEQVAMQMAAFYFVFKAMRTGRVWQWVSGGLCFGLAMFPHMAGRLLPFQGIALLIFFLAMRRDLLRRHMPGFLAFVMGAWAVAAPAVVYWDRARGISMGRIQSVSIFDKNNSNAPVDTLAGFVRNCKVSMLMFNDFGDSRHRNNPLASEKILEHWTAILFGLAFLYALWHWRDPAIFFLLGAFFINLAASIFSVEAPQSLRTAGNIPLVFALIALPLAHLRRALLQAGRWPAGLVFALLLLPAFAFFSLRSGQKYFVQARNLSFDVQPTYIAMIAGQEGKPEDQAAFWATGFASSHPPVILFAQTTPIRNFFSFGEYLPIAQQSGRDHLLFLNDEFQQALPYLRWLYPEAPVRPMPNLLGGADLAVYVKVPKEQAQAIQGMRAELKDGGRTVSLQGAEPAWPVAGHERADEGELNGSVYFETFARHRLEADGQGDVSIWLNRQLVFERRGGSVRKQEAVWGRGLQALRIRFSGARGPVRIRHSAAQVPGPLAFFVQRSTTTQELNRSMVFGMEPYGFYAEYFSNRLPQGPSSVEALEPMVLNRWLDSPLPGNYSVRWRGRVQALKAGPHRFSYRGGAVMSRIRVNGRLVWRQGMLMDQDDRGEAAWPTVELQPGWHEVEAVASFVGPPYAELRMAEPGGPEEVIMPPRVKPILPR